MVRALALHAEYACRSSGACCSSGWEIAVEAPLEDRLRAGLRSGRLRLRPSPFFGPATPLSDGFRPMSGLPDGARSVLAFDAAGRCAFLEPARGNRCAIHRQLGEEALPQACREFPRVVTLTPLGVSLTLSHYCPTAAGLLFRGQAGEAERGPDPLLRIVCDPPVFPPTRAYEGLRAQGLLPLVRPGVFMSWEALAAWEAHAVAVLARAGAPESALDRLAADAEGLRRWTPAAGGFEPYLAATLAAGETGGAARPRAPGVFEAWDAAAAAVPAGHPRPADPRPPATHGEADPAAALVAGGWPSLEAPIRRWLAAKAFASWLALQGEGVRTYVAGLRTARGVLYAEALRGCRQAGRGLEPELLREAIRRADLLLVHLVDPQALAARLSRCELLRAC